MECQKQAEGSLEVFIVVSHGFFVDMTYELLTPDNQPKGWCDYCAVTAFEVKISGEEITKRLVIETDASHVKTK